MIAIFYDEGRLGRRDPAEAAAFYEKAFTTTFTDDRGCVHSAAIADIARRRYVALQVYELRTHESRDKAMAVLQNGGPQFASELYLLSKNMMPASPYELSTSNLDAMAEELRNPPPTETQLYLALAWRVGLWLALAVSAFVGAVVAFRLVRRRLGYKDEASLYRAAFAVYDAIHGLVARFGLVAQGLVGIFLGLSLLFGDVVASGLGFGNIGSPYNLGTFGVLGFNVPYGFMVMVSGAGMFLGGVAKLVEAARVSMAPKNTLVHGSARPAAEPEARAAARGDIKAADLGNTTFSD